MLILGIDPGSRITGFGVLEIIKNKSSTMTVRHVSHGVILLEAKMPFALRMKELGESMQSLLEKYKPEQVVIEKIFLGKNADSAFKLGHARGVAMYESACSGAEVIEYATRLVKKGIAGSGGASKEEVQQCLQRLLKIPTIQRTDASDALAMATYHAYQRLNPLLFKSRNCQIDL